MRGRRRTGQHGVKAESRIYYRVAVKREDDDEPRINTKLHETVFLRAASCDLVVSILLCEARKMMRQPLLFSFCLLTSASCLLFSLHTVGGQDDAFAFGKRMTKVKENSGFPCSGLRFSLWLRAEYHLLKAMKGGEVRQDQTSRN